MATIIVQHVYICDYPFWAHCGKSWLECYSIQECFVLKLCKKILQTATLLQIKVHYLMTALHRTKYAWKTSRCRVLFTQNISIHLFIPVEGIDSKFFVITREKKHTGKLSTHHLAAIFSWSNSHSELNFLKWIGLNTRILRISQATAEIRYLICTAFGGATTTVAQGDCTTCQTIKVKNALMIAMIM